MRRWRMHHIHTSSSTIDATGSPLRPTQAKCDFLFFADPNVVMSIESAVAAGQWRRTGLARETIRNGAPNVAGATTQLQAGARVAEALAPRGLETSFRPSPGVQDLCDVRNGSN